MLLAPNPTRLQFVDYDDKRKELEKHLRYHDKKVDFEIKKFRNAHWYATKYGDEAYVEKLAELKASRIKSLLFEDDSGLWTYTGLAPYLSKAFQDEIKVNFKYPEPKLIPWSRTPTKTMRPYQTQALELLLEKKHGAVEIGTGLGKSFIILHLLKRLGLKAVIMAPSISIAEQLHKDITHHFGSRYVGAYFGGKKKSDKLFVVGVAQSLTRIEEGSQAYEDLIKAQVFIADESHMCPAATLARVCFGVMKDAPYRFFFSGTQMRNDGLDLVLDAITGEIVFRMTVREGVDQGYLAKPKFKMIKIKSSDNTHSSDANRMTRAHLYYNDSVNAVAADIANKSVRLLNRPTLILIEEMEQFTKLLPHLKFKPAFAHGGVTAENKGKIPEQYWDSDPNELVADFNAGKIPILIGTSCISMGTDIQAVKSCIYLQGGKSEPQVKQAVGRVTRLVEGKVDCMYWDFDVENIDVTSRHALERRAIYEDIYGPVEEVVYGMSNA